MPALATRAVQYLRSLLSRALAAGGLGARVHPTAKEARRISCNGVEGALDPCEHRLPSAACPGSFICGACGCGDNRSVLVGGDVPPYEKLDYPHLVCPVRMPGFSNYRPQAGVSRPSRVAWIEERFGVEQLHDFARRQSSAFRLQQWLERGVRVLRQPWRIARRLRRAVSGR
jgi:hypothetical protein